MKKKILWFLFALFAILIGLYPSIYFFMDGKTGLLSSKPDWILNSTVWHISFYTHILLGGLALLIGWLQFNNKIRINKPQVHRNIGKIYIVSVLVSAIAGFYIALFAEQGLWASLGFVCLAIIWFTTTLMGYITIRNKQIINHQIFMIYSYAACFAAVTLRIWLPLLIMSTGNFGKSYIIVAWLCWIPNLLVAHLIVRKLATQKTRVAF
ncbi:DUF2306 domain-containing protein [Pedobacter duraquae]|uniref:Putative membrane protein DUF2306 n=1 Tax=Pedobacter duraquae TaxID=425511 RepID=A0A4R6IP83_9SPHI|nr:DUF2306 domain-containing protein [Pedobacter duraquae]TDO23806.1 putative membrane protein DUF2306 [Pedobacter duraquae]